jgi:hypothetical protein
MVRKAYLDEDCRIHGIELLREVIQSGGGFEVEISDCATDIVPVRGQMVDSGLAMKYQAIRHFDTKWGIQCVNLMSPLTPFYSTACRLAPGDEFTEEGRRLPRIIGTRDFPLCLLFC